MGGVRVAAPGQQASCGGLRVTAYTEVRTDLFHRRGGDILRRVPDTNSIRATTNLRFIARARFATSGESGCGKVLESIAAVAFGAVFETGEGVVVSWGGAEGETGCEGHVRG